MNLSGNRLGINIFYICRHASILIIIVLLSGPLAMSALANPGGVSLLPAPHSENGSIGLTLSGGGARGLAHIGILHLIDSLGIEVDYISGTSMGAIVGALYASGYSAREIESIALSVDWEGVLGQRPDLEYVHVRKRKNHERSVIELPFKDRGIQFKTGLIEGQQLWSLLEGLFFHVRHIDNFNDLSVPFACVATDIETGDPVVLDRGDIVTALRASMAIPAVFTAVNRDDKMLFDGGVVNNYPVDVVKEMGADFIIGVNVSVGLRSAGELHTPIQIIYQMGFFKDAHMSHINMEQTDLFMSPCLDGFSAASFPHVKEIIEKGKEAARSHSADLESIARRQQAVPGRHRPGQPDRIRSIVVDSVSFRGLENIRSFFIRNLADIRPGDTLDVNEINRKKNRLYATGYFEKITYTYIPDEQDPGRAHLIFNFSESPPTNISAAIHYNSFAGVGLIGGISTYNFLFHNLDAEARVRIGEQPALRGGLDFFLGSNQRTWGSIHAYGDIIKFPVFKQFETIGRYEESYFRVESSINHSVRRHSFLTTGAAFYSMSIKPVIKSGLQVSGYKRGFETFAKWNRYSLDQHSFPRKGQDLTIETTYFSGQEHSLDNPADEGGASGDLSDQEINIQNFFRMQLNWRSFIPLNNRLTYFTHIQAGYNYSYTQGFIEMFNLGGTYPFLRNQLTFTGLNEFEIITASAVTAGMGWHYNVWSEFYLSPVLNAAIYDFKFENLDELSTDQLIFGAGLSAGYLSLIGPMKVSVTYSPQTNHLLAYINLGWSF